MTFTDTQRAELRKPLDPAHVKGRKQGGSNVSYVEGWHVIAEANRIFDFDGWSRETVYNHEVCRYEVTIGDNKVPGWKVGYEAKVRVPVAGVVREGTGHGSGVAKDLFDAIEGAAKEAETDAMKRALMTFGNPFGLALYDKTKANVQAPAPPTYDVDAALAGITGCDTELALKQWWKLNDAQIPDEHRERLIEAVNSRTVAVKAMATVAA